MGKGFTSTINVWQERCQALWGRPPKLGHIGSFNIKCNVLYTFLWTCRNIHLLIEPLWQNILNIFSHSYVDCCCHSWIKQVARNGGAHFLCETKTWAWYYLILKNGREIVLNKPLKAAVTLWDPGYAYWGASGLTTLRGQHCTSWAQLINLNNAVCVYLKVKCQHCLVHGMWVMAQPMLLIF